MHQGTNRKGVSKRLSHNCSTERHYGYAKGLTKILRDESINLDQSKEPSKSSTAIPYIEPKQMSSQQSVQLEQAVAKEISAIREAAKQPVDNPQSPTISKPVVPDPRRSRDTGIYAAYRLIPIDREQLGTSKQYVDGRTQSSRQPTLSTSYKIPRLVKPPADQTSKQSTTVFISNAYRTGYPLVSKESVRRFDVYNKQEDKLLTSLHRGYKPMEELRIAVADHLNKNKDDFELVLAIFYPLSK